MDGSFNPYEIWLGLTGVSSTPNHYVLLGLPLYEADAQAIKQACDRATTRVRSFRPGDKAKHWATLLDEIDQAKRCLLDPAAKQAYDDQLRRSGGAAASPGFAAKAEAAWGNGQSARTGNPAMFPPGMGGPSAGANMPLQPRYGPAGPAPDDAPQQLASAPSSPASLYAPGFGGAAASSSIPLAPASAAAPAGTAIPTSLAPAGPGSLPVGQVRRVPMGPSDALSASLQGLSGDPMAPMPHVVAGKGPAIDPMAPISGEMLSSAAFQPIDSGAAAAGVSPAMMPAAALPAGAGAMLGQPLAAQPVMGQPVFGQPVGSLDPMAPVSSASGLSPYGYPMAAAGIGAVAAAQGAVPVGSQVWGTPSAAAPAPQVKSSPRPAGKSRGGQKLLLASIAVTAALAVGIVAAIALWDINPSTPNNSLAQGNGSSTSEGDSGQNNGKQPFENQPANNNPPQPAPTPNPTPIPAPIPAVEPQPPDPAPQPAPKPDPPVTDPVPTPDPPPMPAPDPAPAPEEPPLTPQQLAALKETLLGARQALGARNFGAATQHLADAERLARSPQQKQAVERLKQLDHYVHEFWRAVDQGYANLQPASELTVGTLRAAIVEIRPDALVIRISGRNRTIPRNEIPSGLAMAIANTWFDGSPQNKVVKGAFLLVDPAGKPEDARRMWQEAQAAGFNLEALMPVIDDKYEF